MSTSESVLKALSRLFAALAACAFGASLSGCADMTDTMSQAFADPARYEFFDCKQLEGERKSLANRAGELQRLMDKARTGVGGTVVAELAYRNDYIAVRGQSHFAEEAWRKNNCHEGMPSSTPAPPTRPDVKPAPPSKSGKAVY